MHSLVLFDDTNQLSHFTEGVLRSILLLFFAVLGDIAVLHRGTPLYGQPAWWGDEDAGQSGRPEENRSDRKREKLETGIFFSAF